MILSPIIPTQAFEWIGHLQEVGECFPIRMIGI